MNLYAVALTGRPSLERYEAHARRRPLWHVLGYISSCGQWILSERTRPNHPPGMSRFRWMWPEAKPKPIGVCPSGEMHHAGGS